MKQQLRSNFKQAKGFTLIELIIVIIILGILAVTAAPKFIDIQGDAKKSVMQGVEGSLNSAATMVHAKALIAGIVDGNISVGTATIKITNSYPDAISVASLLDFDTNSISQSGGTFQHASATTAAECQVVYSNAGANGEPGITPTLTDC